MKVFVLHECIDVSDFYANSKVLMVSADKNAVKEKMNEAYTKTKALFDADELSEDETWCNDTEAFVVADYADEEYHRHCWKIDEFEV